MSVEYDELAKLLREAQTLISAAELLGWDQETMMPRKAAAFRAEEKVLLSTLAHERATHARLGELLSACEADEALRADPRVAANLREIRRSYDRSVKLPLDLVAEMSETNTLGMEAWKVAREQNDFKQFQPWMEKQLRLNRRKAECWGTPDGGELYDALLDDFEPNTSVAEVERIFRSLREELTPLIGVLTSSAHQPTDAAFRAYVRRLPLAIGNAEAGRYEARCVAYQEATERLEQLTARLSLLPSVDATDRQLQQHLADEQATARKAFEVATIGLDAALQRARAQDNEPDEKGGV